MILSTLQPALAHTTNKNKRGRLEGVVVAGGLRAALGPGVLLGQAGHYGAAATTGQEIARQKIYTKLLTKIQKCQNFIWFNPDRWKTVLGLELKKKSSLSFPQIRNKNLSERNKINWSGMLSCFSKTTLVQRSASL